MRNLICLGILALALALAAPVSAAQNKQTPKPKDSVVLTGNDWMASSRDEKAAFLLGVEMAIATEFHVAEMTNSKNKEAKDKKKMPRVSPSPFARGWLKAFKDTTRPQMMVMIDDYLERHPDERGRQIFDIIWYEFIAPQTKKARAA